ILPTANFDAFAPQSQALQHGTAKKPVMGRLEPPLARLWRPLNALVPLCFPPRSGFTAGPRCSTDSLSVPMRLSRFFLPILKENPKEAEIVSHRLMLRAGMIRQEAAGIYA